MAVESEVSSSLVLHWPGNAKTFSPFSNLSLPSWFPVWFVFDQLVHLDEVANVRPQLAESWDVSDDGRRYVFHLRQGVTWHDGHPFTASDVAFTYTMLVDPRSGSRYRSLATPIQGTGEYSRGEAQSVEGLRVLDDLTIEMELAHPNFGFVPSMGFPIMPRHILGDLGPDEELDSTEFATRSPVGTGPFSLESHTQDGDAVFAANSLFWGGPPRVDRIILRRLDDEKALEAFEAGEIDLMFIDALDSDRILARPGVEVQAFNTNEYRTIAFNPDHPVLKDRRVREAILVAIDRQAIVDRVLKGMGEVIYSHLIMPEWTVNHDLDGQYPYDPERARALLAEAGHGSGVTLGVTTGPGAIPARHNAPFLGEVVRYLAEVGIEVEVNIKPVVEYVDDLERGNFELYTCCGASGPDPDFTTIYYHSSSLPPNGANGARYVSQEADKLLKEGRETADPTKRAAVYHRLAALLAHDLPTLALWHENRVLAINDGVRGDFTALGMCWLPGTLPDSVQWNKTRPENR